MDSEREDISSRQELQSAVYEGEDQLGPLLAGSDAGYGVVQSEADMMPTPYIVNQAGDHDTSTTVQYVMQGQGDQQTKQFITLTRTRDGDVRLQQGDSETQHHYITLADARNIGQEESAVNQENQDYNDVYGEEGVSRVTLEGRSDIAKAYLSASSGKKDEEGLLHSDEQDVLGSELIPGDTLPTEYLQFSSQADQEDEECQQREILIRDVFLDASATLSDSFLQYVSLTHDPNYLQTMEQEFDVVLHQNAEAFAYQGKVDALQKLERFFLHHLFGPTLPANTDSKETQTDPKDKDINEDQTKDQSVMCDIPRPLFSRSGRQLKIKAELYEDDIEEDMLFEPPVEDIARPKSQDKDKDKEVTEQTISPTKTTTGKRRGRPPKKKPKMIHVDQNTKKVTVKDAATGETPVVVPEQVIVTENSDNSTNEKTVEAVVSEETRRIKDEKSAELDMVKKEDIPADDKPYLRKCVVPTLNTQKKERERDLKREHEQKMPFKYFCEICSFQTKRKSHLEKHMEIHATKKLPLYHCDVCSFKTIRSGHLSQHLLTHSDNCLVCKHCDYKSLNRNHMREHIKKKHPAEAKPNEDQPVEVLNCEICGYKTARLQIMKRHLRVHRDEDSNSLVPVFECKMCPYKSLKKLHYKRHLVDVHSEKRPFLCDTCGRGFKRADALRQHRVIHMDKAARTYPYYCNVCAKGFRTPAHLKEHSTIHSTARPYLCDICGACFKTKSVQRKHTATLHSNPRAHQCPSCHRRFNTHFTLQRHLKSHENDVDVEELAVAVENNSSVSGLADQQGIVSYVDENGDVVMFQNDHNAAAEVIEMEHNQATQQQIENANAENVSMQIVAPNNSNRVTENGEQVIQMVQPEPIYLQQGSTVQIVTHNELTGVEQVQMVMIQGEGNHRIIEGGDYRGQIIEGGDYRGQIIEGTTGGGTEAETLLYLASLPNMQTAGMVDDQTMATVNPD